jgi:hypothetical protein
MKDTIVTSGPIFDQLEAVAGGRWVQVHMAHVVPPPISEKLVMTIPDLPETWEPGMIGGKKAWRKIS